MRGLTLACVALMLLVCRASGNAAVTRRVALVIGVGHYKTIGALSNPPHDAEAVGPALRKLNFDVSLVVDPDYETMKQALREFHKKAADATTVLLYYAGHGLQVAGRNYILPTNAAIGELSDLRYEAFDVQGILDEEMDAPGRVKLVILDACRDNPLSRSLAAHLGTRSVSLSQGLGPMETQVGGTLIAYATAPDTVAADGTGRDSPFTTALLRHIATPGLDIRQMLTRVRADVQAATNGHQRPWVSESLDADFYFAPKPEQPADEEKSAMLEIALWQSIAASARADDFKAYLDRYPHGTFVDLARSRLALLTRQDDLERQQKERQAVDLRSVLTDLTTLGYYRGAVAAGKSSDALAAVRLRQAFEGHRETGELTDEERDGLHRDAGRMAALSHVAEISPRGVAAASVKSAQGRFDRGWDFETGKTQPKDYAEAAYWYTLAAADGVAVAYTNLGTLSARDGNMADAVLLWRSAAARGEGAAMFNLGAVAEKGIGGPASLELAKQWYARGARRGHADCIAALKRLG